jgi:hypothetical protein
MAKAEFLYKCDKCDYSFQAGDQGQFNKVRGRHLSVSHGIKGRIALARAKKKKGNKRGYTKRLQAGTDPPTIESLQASNRVLGDLVMRLLLEHTRS